MVSDQAVLTLAERAHDMEFHTAVLGSIGSSHFNCLWNQSIFGKYNSILVTTLHS
jgi:hypothetical protein